MQQPFEESRRSKKIAEYRKVVNDTKKHRFYLYFHGVVLLIAYELLFRIFYNPNVVLYNGVDLWFQIAEALIPMGTLVFSLGIIFYWGWYLYFDYKGYKTKGEVEKDKNEKKPKAKEPYKPNWYYFFIQILEGFVYGSLLIIFLPFLNPAVVNFLTGEFQYPNPLDANETLYVYQTNFFQDLGLAFGAGFYDEVLFRWLLPIGVAKAIKSKYKPKTTNASISIPIINEKISFFSIKDTQKNFWVISLISAAIFSLSHFVLPYGQPFNFYALVYRVIFGLVMIYIYNFGKLPVAAWTHVFYDLWYFLLT